jgi:hypothetical protein
MGDAKLKVIATELITKVRSSVTIDWTLRESARAKIRVIVKRILKKYGYPPDLQEEAVKPVLEGGRSGPHGHEVVIPYAMSDYATSFATVSLDELLAAME